MTSPIVPVGASTVAWALRNPCCPPRDSAVSQLRRAAAANSASGQFAASRGTGGIDNPSYESPSPPAPGGGGGGSGALATGGGRWAPPARALPPPPSPRPSPPPGAERERLAGAERENLTPWAARRWLRMTRNIASRFSAEAGKARP